MNSTLPPLPSPTSSSSKSRPLSDSDTDNKSSPKKKQTIKAAKYNHFRNKNEKKALTSANASLKASEKCFLKVHGIGDSPFLMELVSYDTIKTVRSLLGNVLKSEFVRKNFGCKVTYFNTKWRIHGRTKSRTNRIQALHR